MRADKFFAERFGSRTKAQAVLERGLVLRNGKPLSPDSDVSEGDNFTFLNPESSFVSNGGYKLARGLDAFHASVEGKIFVDIGASTGGFTDCLLQRGAKQVYCVDVGESQLAETLKNDERVVIMDRTNARLLNENSFPEPIDGVVCDVSFISLKYILPAVPGFLKKGSYLYVLFKPQFECEGKGIGKRGILPQRYHGALLKDFYSFCTFSKLAPRNIVNAPIRPKKNIEYVIELELGGNPIPEHEFMLQSQKIFENLS